MADLGTDHIRIKELAKKLSPANIPEVKETLRIFQFRVAENFFTKARKAGSFQDPVFLVDGRANKKPDKVKFGGKIRIMERGILTTGSKRAKSVEFLPGLDLEVLSLLIAASPVRSGQYSLSHFMYFNGVERNPSPTGNILEEPSDSMIFINRMPYAKRLEGVRGFSSQQRLARATGKKGRYKASTITDASRNWMSTQTPNGIYPVVAKKIARKYKGQLVVRFTYMQNPDFHGQIYSGKKSINATVYSKTRKTRMPAVFPAIIIQLELGDEKLRPSLQFKGAGDQKGGFGS